MSATKLLAIDVGSRELGAAVFDDGELRYYAVKSLAKKPPETLPAEAARVTRALIHEHKPFRFALAQPIAIHHGSERVARMIRAVKNTALHEGLAVSVMSPKAVRQYICSSDKATKKDTYERVCAIYPELEESAGKLKAWDDYYEPMLNAVATGLTCVLNRESVEAAMPHSAVSVR